MTMRPGAVVPIVFLREEAEYRGALASVARPDFDILADTCAAFLHPTELARFRSLEFDRRRRSYLLGRYAAKQALVAYGDHVDPTQVEICAGVFHQPVVRGLAEPTGVSISHSERAACALAYPELHPLSIDIEDTVPSRDEVMKTQILPAELERAAKAWAVEAAVHCTMIWTAKEALSKILRCGMTCPYELFAVKNLHAGESGFGGEFEHFAQYKFQSWILGDSVVSIVLPRKSTMQIDMQPVTRAVS